MKSVKKMFVLLMLLMSLSICNSAFATAYDVKLKNCGSSGAELSFKVDDGGWYYVLASIGSGDTGWKLTTALFPWKGTLYGTTQNTFVVITEHQTGDTVTHYCD